MAAAALTTMDVKNMYKRNHPGSWRDPGIFLTAKKSTTPMTIRATPATTIAIRCTVTLYPSNGR